MIDVMTRDVPLHTWPAVAICLTLSIGLQSAPECVTAFFQVEAVWLLIVEFPVAYGRDRGFYDPI